MIAHAGIFKSDDEGVENPKQAKDKAMAAAAALTAAGYSEAEVITIVGGSDDAGEALASAWKNGYLEGIRHRVTKEIEAGHAAVLTKLALFSAAPTGRVLDEHGAERIIAGSAPQRHLTEGFMPVWSRKRSWAPTTQTPMRSTLSEMVGLPTIIRTKGGRAGNMGKFKFSKFIGMPMTIKSKPIIGGPMILRKRFTN